MTSSTWDTVTKPPSMQPQSIDDAAERRIREIESFAEHAYRNSGGDMKEAIRSALRTAWREGAESATEAAAKKCEEVSLAKLTDCATKGQVLDLCAAAIRGGKL